MSDRDFKKALPVGFDSDRLLLGGRMPGQTAKKRLPQSIASR